YVGSTSNLKRRFYEHNSGKSPSTQNRQPLKLIFYEAYQSKRDGERREMYLKTAKGKTTIKSMLKDYFKNSYGKIYQRNR
ncbi:hypothetical protein DRH29_02480, partial [candidate division Kazan bacterium]